MSHTEVLGCKGERDRARQLRVLCPEAEAHASAAARLAWRIGWCGRTEPIRDAVNVAARPVTFDA
jgi:hypothetical protein